MATFTPAAAYWAAVLAESTDTLRASAIADAIGASSKLKFYDAGDNLLRTVTAADWTKGTIANNYYPITPDSYNGSQTGTGTPTYVVFTTSADVEICRMSAGVNSGLYQIPSAFATGVDLTPGTFVLKYPTEGTAPTGKVWYPGHYMMVNDDVNRLGMQDSRRNLVRYNSNWVGYYGHYWWHRMESTQGVYDFSILTNDLDKAEADGKKMWIMLNNRSFHGAARGAFCPQYIVDAGWTYAYTGGGQNFMGPKLWVSGCGQAWLDFMVAAIDACEGHPALQGFLTEECQESGAWLQAGWTWQLINAFLLEQSRLGAEHCVTSLFHNNMSWSNEPSDNLTEHYRMTDTMVNVHKTGVTPNDLSMNSYLLSTLSPYGKYVFDRYVGVTYHMAQVEWETFFYPQTPRELLNYGVDTLGMQFIGWQSAFPSGATFTATDIIDEVTRQNGRINTARPLNAPE